VAVREDSGRWGQAANGAERESATGLRSPACRKSYGRAMLTRRPDRIKSGFRSAAGG